MKEKPKPPHATGPKRKLSHRYARNTPIEEQLKGMDCQRHNPIIQTNSKGKEFRECSKCGAFLGMV